jgi:hypothetical protein
MNAAQHNIRITFPFNDSSPILSLDTTDSELLPEPFNEQQKMRRL